MVSNKDKGLYSSDSKFIVKLTHNDFEIKNGEVFIKNLKKNKKYNNNLGLLKLYAEWCGHCHDVEKVIKFISNKLHKDKFTVFVIDYAKIPDKKKDDFIKLIGVNSFPSFFMINNLKLEKIEINDRTEEGFLTIISKKVLEYCQSK